jgi:hypothetical protein
METIARLCKQCGKDINPDKGRKDRKFCDENCKNKFHNTQAYLEEQEIKRIQHVLKKNRRALKKVFGRADKDAIKKDRLLKEGFEFDYHTHFVTTKIKRNQFIFCFDYGYREVEEGLFKIVKAFDYKED